MAGQKTSDQKLFDTARHYGKVVKDEEKIENGKAVRITWFSLAGALILTIRENGELFLVKEFAGAAIMNI